ncbi:MAG: phosphoribosyl-ATP pyrophosphohydrolase [Alphaproteobacteria bacterium]|nr:phosphoribosyl-ATP pyrophosphohydrolase [Alphaproteobacteria bacterium]
MTDRPLAALAARLMQVSDLYAERHGIDRSGDWPMLKLAEEVGEMTQAWLRRDGRARGAADDPQAALAEEAADVLATVLLIAHAQGIDLDAAIDAKWFAHLAPVTNR